MPTCYTMDIAGEIDGSEALHITKDGLLLDHKFWAAPTVLYVNGFAWSTADQTFLPNSGPMQIMPQGLSFNSAKLTRVAGRDLTGIEAGTDETILYLADNPNGSDHYEVQLAFSAQLSADANVDGKVDFADYLTLETNFGKSRMGWQQADFNGDGKVTFSDYLLLEANFGKSIPEPTTLSLLALCGLAIKRRRGLH